MTPLTAEQLQEIRERDARVTIYDQGTEHERVGGDHGPQSAIDRRLLLAHISALCDWQPIETAPRDGSYIILGNSCGTWIGHYCATSPGGYVFENPWATMMLNHRHMEKFSSSVPTHWKPLPPAPYTGEK